MTYNITSIVSENSTGILGITQGVNEVLMFGWLGTLLLIAIIIISFISFLSSTGSTSKSLTGSLFIGFCISLVLGAMNLIYDKTFFIILVLLAGSVAFIQRN